MLAAVERVQGVLDSAGEVADTDTQTEGPVGKAAGTDIGPEELVREIGLIHTCHRTGRNRQVADHKICTASSSMLFEIRQQLGLLCLCYSQAPFPWIHEWGGRCGDRHHGGLRTSGLLWEGTRTGRSPTFRDP
jgi:hypothetical protein